MTTRLSQLVFFISLCAFGCSGTQKQTNEANAAQANQAAARPKAVAVKVFLSPAGGSTVIGMIKITPEGEVAHAQGDFNGLAEGAYTVRILEIRTCDINEAKKANAANEEPYVQDLGVLKADQNGALAIDAKIADPSYSIGEAMVIYANKDDAQAVKNADARLACGLLAKGE
jgi:Cu/Zn superoxide dismutase